MSIFDFGILNSENFFKWGFWLGNPSDNSDWISDMSRTMHWWTGTAWMPEVGWDYGDFWTMEDIVDDAYINNCIPIIMWSPSHETGDFSDYYLQCFIDGDFDTYFEDLATGMAADGREIYFRMFHEMNGIGWLGCGWETPYVSRLYPTEADWLADTNAINTPAKFMSAWQHIVSIFKTEGATNVKFCFTISNLPSSGYEGNYHNPNGAVPLADIYPGDNYVDLLGYEFYPHAQYEYIDEDYVLGAYHELCDQSSSKPIIVAEAGLNPSFTDATYISDYWDDVLNPNYIKSLYPRTDGILIWQFGDWGLYTSALKSKGATAFNNSAYRYCNGT